MTSSQPAHGHGGNAKIDEEVTVMASKAITSLDHWLERAEEVLAEQREFALSPSQAFIWDHSRRDSIVPLETFQQGISVLLQQLCARPGRWILIAEGLAHPHRYWQSIAYEDGALATEVVSNHYLAGDDRLTASQEARLSELGWEAPNPPQRTNWTRTEPTTSPPIVEVAELAIATLRQVFGLGDEHRLLVKLFGSPLRGNTPTSPVYEGDESVNVA